MSVLLFTTEEDLDKLVEAKVQAALANQGGQKPSPRPRARRSETWWKPRILALLAETGSLTEAIGQLQDEGGPSRSTVYRAMEIDRKFKRRWSRAIDAIQAIEAIKGAGGDR